MITDDAIMGDFDTAESKTNFFPFMYHVYMNMNYEQKTAHWYILYSYTGVVYNLFTNYISMIRNGIKLNGSYRSMSPNIPKKVLSVH